MKRSAGWSFGILLATASVALAQVPPSPGGQRGAGGGGQQPPQNLQVMPKDTPRPQVLAAMQNIASAQLQQLRGQ